MAPVYRHRRLASPSVGTELHELTALEQAAAVRSGDVSPTELVEHALARIDGATPRSAPSSPSPRSGRWRRPPRRGPAPRRAATCRRCSACRPRSRTSTTPPASGRRSARRLSPTSCPPWTTPSSPSWPPPAPSAWARRTPPSSASPATRQRAGRAGPLPVGPGAARRRLQRGSGGRRGRRAGPVRAGQRRRRLDPHPGEHQRPVRHQAQPRPGQQRPVRQRGHRLRHQRPAGPHGARRRRDARRHGRAGRSATRPGPRRCRRGRRSSAGPTARRAGCGSAAPPSRPSPTPRSSPEVVAALDDTAAAARGARPRGRGRAARAARARGAADASSAPGCCRARRCRYEDQVGAAVPAHPRAARPGPGDVARGGDGGAVRAAPVQPPLRAGRRPVRRAARAGAAR